MLPNGVLYTHCIPFKEIINTHIKVACLLALEIHSLGSIEDLYSYAKKLQFILFKVTKSDFLACHSKLRPRKSMIISFIHEYFLKSCRGAITALSCAVLHLLLCINKSSKI